MLLAVLLGTRPLAAQTPAEIRAQIAAQVAQQSPPFPFLPPSPRAPSLSVILVRDMGVQSAAQLRGPHSYYSVHFALAHTQLPRAATLKLTYHFDRSLPSQSSTLQLRLNNTLLAVITSPPLPQADGHFAFLSVPTPPELLIRDNELTFEFTGGGVFQSQTTTTLPFVFLSHPTPRCCAPPASSPPGSASWAAPSRSASPSPSARSPPATSSSSATATPPFLPRSHPRRPRALH